MGELKQDSRTIITQWFFQHSDELFRFAQVKVKYREDAEDLVQETFIAAIKSFDSFEGRASVKNWLYAILKNKIIDHYRKTVNFIETFDVEEQECESITDQFFRKNGSWKKEFCNTTWGSDEHLLDNEDFNKTLATCVNKLPEKWRKAIHAKYLLEQEGKTICAMLEISETNYWQILHRGKLLVKYCIDKNWFQQ